MTGTGVAIFEGEKLTFHNSIEGKKGHDWEARSSQIVMQLACLIDGYKRIDAVYIERPQFMDSTKGRVSASSDGLFKLCFHYGRIYQLLFYAGLKINQVRIIDWKGQLNKMQTDKRVKAILPNFQPIKDHDCDAVGIGLYILGKF